MIPWLAIIRIGARGGLVGTRVEFEDRQHHVSLHIA